MLTVVLLAIALGAVSDCSADQIQAGTCSIGGSLSDDGATLDGRGSAPGGSGDGSLDVEGGEGGATEPRCDIVWLGDCIAWISPPPTAAVTMADVAHFAPSVGSHSMEPSGWAVTGLPANVYSTSVTQVLSGVVLGAPADVRFTPVGWRWDYGDGNSRSSPSGGASWADLSVGEFAITPTSHVYSARGTYIITLIVDFTAEYRVNGGPWQRIPGTLARGAPSIRVLSQDARTVLVDEHCLANPRGPGC